MSLLWLDGDDTLGDRRRALPPRHCQLRFDKAARVEHSGCLLCLNLSDHALGKLELRKCPVQFVARQQHLRFNAKRLAD